MYVLPAAYGDQNRQSKPLELEILKAMYCHVGSGTKPTSSARTANAPNH